MLQERMTGGDFKMKNIKLFYMAFLLMVVSALTYQGCSELDKNATMAPELGIHPAGWADTLNPDSPNFHAKYIYNNNKWSLSECRSCHGNDFSGGSTGVSCMNCHTQQGGPENCTTCHGSKDPNDTHPYPPLSLKGDSTETDRGVGAHYFHLSNNVTDRDAPAVRCVACHQKVNNFTDAVHFQNPNGKATIHFDSLSLNVLPGDTLVPNPTYNAVSNTCANVYCHGYFKQGNRNFQPVFNNPESVVCGSCHGDPATGNPTPGYPNNVIAPHFSFMTINSCYVCHGSVINPAGQFIDKTLHVNGTIDFGLRK
jgi:predicted CxxxxCH...CXXCH cytochrome family protein